MSKRFILVLLLSIFFFSTSFGQWEWLNPRPSGYSCLNIFFTDNQNGLILNANGDLLVTTNQGGSWNLKQNFTNAVSMDLKDSTAVIAGYSGAFYISHDSGNTWQAKNSGTSDYFQFVDVVSSDTIFLANTTGKILRTYNGGDSWQSLTCDQQISSIEFINSKVGYVGVTSNYILKTTDGGATWKQNVTINFYPSNTMTIKFLDINTGFAFREHSDLLSTTDGGATWKTYDIGDDIYAFHFISKKIGFAAGEHGIMYKTNDGGLTWTWMSPDGRIEAYDLHSIYFLNSTTGFAVGARGRILKTTDGGATWKTYSPTHIDVSDLALASPTTAYATAGGSIFKTIDSGKNWRPLSFIIGTTYPNLGSFEKHIFLALIRGSLQRGTRQEFIKLTMAGPHGVKCM
jgi:photosystem II stability/assembly factor-like uncharacterized protein